MFPPRHMLKGAATLPVYFVSISQCVFCVISSLAIDPIISLEKELVREPGLYFSNLAFNGEKYFLVWEDSGTEKNTNWGNLHGAFLDRDGRFLTNSRIMITTETNSFGHQVDVVANKLNFLVVWTDVRNP